MKPFLTSSLSRLRACLQVSKHATTRSGRLGATLAMASALGIVSTGMPWVGATPALAEDTAYFDCATDMVDAGVSQTDAIAACAASRYPGDLGECVFDVAELTGISSSSTLLICQRSRRPDEVADCTIDIHAALLDAGNSKVLENCGRSLLPERYSECVIDIADVSELAVNDVLDQCLRAGFRPWRIQPRL